MPTGRPRQFDADKALDAALKVFWSKGFEGTTLPDLTTAMGINRPSLYAAFGNKEALFRQAVERYVSRWGAPIHAALEQPTAREVVESVWRESLLLVTAPRGPRGCFLVQGALACGDDGAAVKREVAAQRGAFEARLAERFQRAQADGELPGDIAPATWAKFVNTVSHGLAVQAASGATREQLQSVIDIALRAWPGVEARSITSPHHPASVQ